MHPVRTSSDHLPTLILDFDGTLTDAEIEGEGFTQGCLTQLAQVTGWSLDRVRERALQVVEELLRDPTAHAWIFDGVAVAPSTVDPYLRIKPVIETVLREAGVVGPGLEEIYKANYPKSGTHFREGAPRLLHELYLRQSPAFVVTNSGTEPVRAKIRHIGMGLAERYNLTLGGLFNRWWIQRIYGNAKKYVPAQIDGFTQTLEIPGLPRSVHLHRLHYFDTLNQLRGSRPWGQVVVVGDVLELDLALPLALGARVGLMANDKTPAYEIAFLRNHPRARVLTHVDQILPFWEGTLAAA